MKTPFARLWALWRHPRSVILDLRPLQCGYAGKGVGRYTFEVARRIARAAEEEARRPHPRFTVGSLILADRPNPLPQVPVRFRAPPWQRPWLWDQLALPFLLLRHGVGLLHNFAILGPLQEVSFPMLYAFRGLATLHDWHMFSEQASPIEIFYRNTVRIRVQKKWLPRLRRIVAVSEQVKVETMLLGKVDADRIAAIPLGGDHLDAVEPEPWSMENFALSVGDTPNKNLAVVRDALMRLRARFVHINWVIVGNRQNIEARLAPAQGAGMESRTLPPWITVLENPSDALLKACYRKALCLLFPSRREGFGIPIVEAMRLGCPVLAADVEPMRSLLRYPPGQIPAGDPAAWAAAIQKLLFFSEVRQASIAHGRARADRYTWDNTVNALLEFYTA